MENHLFAKSVEMGSSKAEKLAMIRTSFRTMVALALACSKQVGLVLENPQCAQQCAEMGLSEELKFVMMEIQTQMMVVLALVG